LGATRHTFRRVADEASKAETALSGSIFSILVNFFSIKQQLIQQSFKYDVKNKHHLKIQDVKVILIIFKEILNSQLLTN